MLLSHRTQRGTKYGPTGICHYQAKAKFDDRRAQNLFSVTGLVVLLLSMVIAANFAISKARAAEGESVYEIIRSTEDRIWRLNKTTGEVSVCTLNGDNLICTNTEDAAVPPSKTYKEIKKEEAAAEARRQEEIAAAEARRIEEQRAEQERQLTIIDRILDMFRELIHMSVEEPAPAE